MSVDESRDRMNVKLESWWQALQSKGFKKVIKKTEYINFTSMEKCKDMTPQIIEAQEIKQRDSFLIILISRLFN